MAKLFLRDTDEFVCELHDFELVGNDFTANVAEGAKVQPLSVKGVWIRVEDAGRRLVGKLQDVNASSGEITGTVAPE